MKKQSIAVIMSATILMSGLFSFGGTYLANELIGKNNLKTEMSTTSQNILSLNGNISQNVTKTTYMEDEKGPLTIAEIAEMNGDSVVEIFTESVTTGGRLGQFVTKGAGSGVVIRSNGYIATNNHVIDGANKITIRLKNGKSYSASLVGRDIKTDLAILKIEASNLTPVIFGDSSKLIVGELAVAIGNPLGELGGTVTEGIISALDRDIKIDGENMKLLQTTAAINPGNSGGGLFNEYGEIIGIVNAKSSGSDIEGIGFAIPINTAKTVTDQIISYGYVQGRIDLGITLIDITNSRTAMMYRVSKTGVYVLRVTKQNGLQIGDRIISIDGTEIYSSSDVKAKIDSLSVGQAAKFVVERSQQIVTLNITLEQDKGN